MKNKKGQLGGIQAGFFALMFMAVAIVVVVIINAFGADFVTTQQADFTAASSAYNVTVSGLQSLETLSEGTGDVTDVGIITIVLGLLVALIGVFGWAGYQRMR
jgi:predicted negative regulator of RcsB-dependent stress response